MNQKEKIGLFTIVALSVLLIPAIAVTAASNAPMAQRVYPLGTVCGDAQAGPYTLRIFYGVSTFEHFYSEFRVNHMSLSGGNTGTVSSTGGYLAVYTKNPAHGGTLVFYATYKGMSGSYSISGDKMSLSSFTASKIVVTLNNIVGHRGDSRVMLGTYYSPNIPTQKVRCGTVDTSQ